ncbi:MAG: M28 family peptidase [Bacteroidetes bacterium]|nr:M28 family peptidase [Bacteroidota bacterium]
MRFAKVITSEDARKHLSVLASDEYEGRETGKEGQKKAAKYISEYFKSIGLKPATDKTYLQKFPLTQSTPESADMEVSGKKYENYKDFYVFPNGKNLNLEAKEILFLGYGISDKKYDDYKNADVKDKILLVLGGEPLNNDSTSFITATKELSDWTTDFRKKSRFAKEKGAGALIVINMNFDANIQFLKNYLESPVLKLENAEEKKEDKSRYGKKIPQAGISIKTANEILAEKKINVDKIKKKIQKKHKAVSFKIKTPIVIEMKNKEEAISSENILGMINGSEFPDEVIFITAHYDHLGVKDGKVYNGADDDGSGTTGVLEIANAFENAKDAGFVPKRSIVFMTVAGEEKGLLGSSYYTDHPVFPIASTVCDLNIDMIGRGDEEHKSDSNFVYIIGSDKISTELHKINESANSTYTKLNLDYKYNDPNDPQRFYYRSDHYNFAEKGVPIIFYFNGVHEDYHQETDEVQKINFPLLAKRAQLVFYTAWEIANRKERIKSDVIQGEEKK